MLNQLNLASEPRFAPDIGVLVILFVAIAGLAIHRGSRVENVADEFAARYWVDALNARSMNDASFEDAENARRLVLETDAARIEQLRRNADERGARYDVAFAAINARVRQDPELGRELGRVSDARNAFIASRAEIFKLMAAGDRARALKKWDSAATDKLRAYRAEIDRFVDFTYRRAVGFSED